MKERYLAEQFLRDHVHAARALAALQLNQLPEEIRSRVNLVNRQRHRPRGAANARGSNETELVRVLVDGPQAAAH